MTALGPPRPAPFSRQGGPAQAYLKGAFVLRHSMPAQPSTVTSRTNPKGVKYVPNFGRPGPYEQLQRGGRGGAGGREGRTVAPRPPSAGVDSTGGSDEGAEAWPDVPDGVAGAEDMVIDMSLDMWRWTLDANLISNYLLMHYVVQIMKRQGSGYILNVSSYFGGEKYTSEDSVFGSIAAVEEFEAMLGDSAEDATLMFHPAETATPEELNSKAFQNSRARFWMGKIDWDGKTVVNATQLMDGLVDYTTLRLKEGSRTLEMTFIGRAEKLFLRQEGNTLAIQGHYLAPQGPVATLVLNGGRRGHFERLWCGLDEADRSDDFAKMDAACEVDRCTAGRTSRAAYEDADVRAQGRDALGRRADTEREIVRVHVHLSRRVQTCENVKEGGHTNL